MSNIIKPSEKLEIGVAHLNFDENGKINTASFTPTLTAFLSGKDISDFFDIDCSEGEKALQDQATAVFSTWFNKLSEIELADREQFGIASELSKCEKYGNGKIKNAEIKFIFKHL